MTVRSTTRPRRRAAHRLVAVLLLLAGAVVLVWPLVELARGDAAQHRDAARHSAEVATIDAPTREREVRQARAYNAALRPTALRDPWGPAQAGSGSSTERDYRARLGEPDVMARLRVPRINLDLPVRHGTETDVLARGVGHLFGSSLPVGGPGTHAVLTGHSGWARGTLFDRLPELREGDLFSVETAGEALTYRVDRVSTVLPTEFDALAPVPGEDHITLITCTPRGVNTHRLLVRGTRILAAAALTTPEAPPASPPDGVFTRAAAQVQPWMYPRLGGAAFALLAAAAIALGAVRGGAR